MLRDVIAAVLAAPAEAARVEASRTITWRRGIMDHITGACAYTVIRRPTGLLAVLHYRVGDTPITEPMLLVATPCTFGGVRWWWQCPGCQRRTGVLFNPARYWRCRHCHAITYDSSNESHKWDRLWRDMSLDPEVGILLPQRYR
jgi:hypothetical protein